MSKKCPNCGYDEANEAKYCHICGQPLGAVQSADDFEYDFGEKEPLATQVNTVQEPTQPTVGFAPEFGVNNPTQSFGATPFGEFEERPYVATTIDNFKANKYKKEVFTWSIIMLIACVLRLIFLFAELDDAFELQSYIPYLYGDALAVITTCVNTYFFGMGVLLLFFVAAIVLLVFTVKLNKYNFPVQNDEVFYAAKKTMIVSIAVAVLVVIYFIIEMVAFANNLKMQSMVEEEVISFSEQIGAVVSDVVLLAGSILSVFYLFKLSNCKQK